MMIVACCSINVSDYQLLVELGTMLGSHLLDPQQIFSHLTLLFFFLINKFIYGCIGSSLLHAGFL